ncbi:UDP-glucose/GDP-mannose dehydrogenase family protein [Bacillus velezensis]|uniref:UDP-glucose 6-dehydrogenase TuaD n=1 Tax=Bacillus amyloliquefaciens group TaxID=1938374 RepID=UPI001374A6A6|nr:MULTISPECIES: UDP-glucose/GDP-mannose dehydrogenase family protein [Bacillus amyloliquefaciens group]MCT6829293.1 UDP-glucose/GDP-mannose dehydrogenase family protein [Bacillus velezensis]MCT6864251.1 UDP-glucose/GDP-mannose dehydrogenase family protein [Bacillus velezensis]QOX75108.1 UDP-glucose/GDP-mannose dehydrogenase family protein [Bacillus velezensis]QVV93426.1 UDP-glucose/GDP-mannose dehydrogenase family protein [Bacillus amyloliquefaciens]QYR15799.1 UDP-glucose/GDP-mannose dehydrog
MKKIAVLGTGYVGLVSGTCFAEIGHHVTCCDINEAKIRSLQNGVIPIYEPGLEELAEKNVSAGRLSFTADIEPAVKAADIVYIAVGTPMSKTGEADLTYIKAAAQTIGEQLNGYKIIVTKSTVPVGTGKLVYQIVSESSKGTYPFDVASNPEFLREGSAVRDTMQMERAVIGATSEHAASVIEELHKPFRTKIVKTNLESAEMIKYAANAFLAAKISFINDIANICERVGADISHVSEGVGLDSRIGNKFLQAGIGFGGSCFPKDTTALLHIANAAGYPFEMMEAVIETNQKQRVRITEKLNRAIGPLKGKTVAVLGLAFKPHTNDVRSAPALDIITSLKEQGAHVKAYDPIAIPEAAAILGEGGIEYHAEMYSAIKNADACLITTDWPEVKEMDLQRVKRLLKQPVIIDGRNMFPLEYMRVSGFTYHSVGRPAVHADRQIKELAR